MLARDGSSCCRFGDIEVRVEIVSKKVAGGNRRPSFFAYRPLDLDITGGLPSPYEHAGFQKTECDGWPECMFMTADTVYVNGGGGWR